MPILSNDCPAGTRLNFSLNDKVTWTDHTIDAVYCLQKIEFSFFFSLFILFFCFLFFFPKIIGAINADFIISAKSYLELYDSYFSSISRFIKLKNILYFTSETNIGSIPLRLQLKKYSKLKWKCDTEMQRHIGIAKNGFRNWKKCPSE